MSKLIKKRATDLNNKKSENPRHLPERLRKSSKTNEAFAFDTLEQTDITASTSETDTTIDSIGITEENLIDQSDVDDEITDNNDASEYSAEHSDADNEKEQSPSDDFIGTLDFTEMTSDNTPTFNVDNEAMTYANDKTESGSTEESQKNLDDDTLDKIQNEDRETFLTASLENKKECIGVKLPASYLDIEKSVDGVDILPCNIDIYEDCIISEEVKDLAKEIGRKSFTHGRLGNLVVCIVVKTQNCFALLKKDKKSGHFELIWMMQRIDVVKKVKASDGRVYVDVLISDDLDSKQVRIPVTDFKESQVSNLMRYNIALFSKYSMTMSIYFQKLLEKMPTEDAGQKLGVVIDSTNKDFTFNAYKMEDGFTYESEYDDWDEFVQPFNKLVAPSYPLQYLIAVSMSVPVLTLLQKKSKIDVHSYCVNIIGSSSTGKTISSRFCAALWTDPNSDKIFSAMLATGNAALKRLDGRYGIPTFLDEATVLGGISTTEYGYSVYEEREKRRLNSDCSEKASGTWSTVVIMSSEQHFHSNSKVQNGGMAVRVHSMENLSFTTDKNHADALNEFVRRNWGVVGLEFTNSLFDGEFGDLEDLYENAKEKMREVIGNSTNSFTDRLINTYAITYMTAVMLESMGIDINVDEVAEIMAAHNIMVGNEQNLALNAYRAIISFVTRNPAKFGIRKFMNEVGQVTKLAIEESLLENILTNAGFTDMKVTVKELDKAGYLIRQQQGRLKSKLTIDDNLCYGYQIDMTELAEGVETVAEKVKKLVDDDDEYLV